MCLTPISLLSLSNNYLTAKTLSLLLQYLSPRTCFRRVKLQSQQPSSDHVQPVHIYDVISIITCMPKYPAVHWGKKRKERLMSEIRSIGTITKKKKLLSVLITAENNYYVPHQTTLVMNHQTALAIRSLYLVWYLVFPIRSTESFSFFFMQLGHPLRYYSLGFPFFLEFSNH